MISLHLHVYRRVACRAVASLLEWRCCNGRLPCPRAAVSRCSPSDYVVLPDQQSPAEADPESHNAVMSYVEAYQAGQKPSWTSLDLYNWRQRLKSGLYR